MICWLTTEYHLFTLSHSGEDASLPLSSGGSYQILVNNVFYFTQRLVDKLWQGMFNKDSKLVVEFIVQLIGQVQAEASKHANLQVDSRVTPPSEKDSRQSLSLVLCYFFHLHME